MVRAVPLLLSGALALSLSACAGNQASSLAIRKPQAAAAPATPAAPTQTGRPGTSVPALGFAATAPKVDDAFPLRQSFRPAFASKLAGRSIPVSRLSDIKLENREVVLTFDDGPVPGKTRRILAALDEAGVGATFLMVGAMANAYPAIAREVAARGHTIGTHTQSHRNLAHLSDEAAMAEIRAGQRSVAAALAPAGFEPAPFFRFPYLADRPSLRQRISEEGIVAIDVDVDSKDYFHATPDAVKDRTLLSLEMHGRGIILFHDIHERTAAMLPGLLAGLERRGFKVVRLVPPGNPPLVASLQPAATPAI
ncbi:polysaccharide deacetylase family protein [Aureimonas pseudogalii]|uniref:Chitooligosaccharide deacetylase n=1 Tax=Aureimonas pseudogalii TaxID=1744844 RepID=A0A7W6EGQ2_9HYPH|nr:polysaccharide deacetylase family protein [Aureimonas pseudogalii]MBB3997649.1 peptidoglycan/xylan/chitin deacetylase (PgdA/CDA1 family) [Aureimonas pseudogalii]